MRGGRVREANPLSGVLLVDKPVGPTSHDVVAAVRQALATRRVGHFGTLDPFATGLLVCGVGPATRLASFCAAHEKTYAATIRLGWSSTTDDPTGELTEHEVERTPDREEVERACRSWTGQVDQIPPVFSAKHVSGERSHALARRGQAVALAPVAVEIRSIVIESYRYPDLEVRVRCGPGTYVRALARDLGEALGTGGYCHALRRLVSGPFTVDGALALDELPTAAARSLLPSLEALPGLPRVRLDEAAARTVAGGAAVRLPDQLPASGWVALIGPQGFIGLGEVLEDAGGSVRPRRILYPEGEDR